MEDQTATQSMIVVESVQREHGAEAGAVLRDAHQLVQQAHDLAQRFA